MRMLVLDFDGVICDALVECALVTWLGLRPASQQAPVSSYLPALPREFVRRFQQVRDYSRVLDHFVVAHRPAAARVRSQADFDTLFATIGAGFVARFTAAATAARQRCRRQEREFWLDLHTLYAGIPDLLRRHAGMVDVVTAKDAESVRTILSRHGLGHTVREVVGECAGKAEAVRYLSSRHGVRPADVLFVDDNLTNVRRVAATGVPTRWATWGYHTPEDLAGAGRAGIDRLDLAAVPALDLTNPEVNCHAESSHRTDQPRPARRHRSQHRLLRARGGPPVPGLPGGRAAGGLRLGRGRRAAAGRGEGRRRRDRPVPGRACRPARRHGPVRPAQRRRLPGHPVRGRARHDVGLPGLQGALAAGRDHLRERRRGGRGVPRPGRPGQRPARRRQLPGRRQAGQRVHQPGGGGGRPAGGGAVRAGEQAGAAGGAVHQDRQLRAPRGRRPAAGHRPEPGLGGPGGAAGGRAAACRCRGGRRRGAAAAVGRPGVGTVPDRRVGELSVPGGAAGRGADRGGRLPGRRAAHRRPAGRSHRHPHRPALPDAAAAGHPADRPRRSST